MSVTESIQKFGNDAYNKAGELAGKADKAADGFFSKNKGFIIGLVVALTALFSMDSGSSGMVPMLFGLAALAVGIFADKDGIFQGLFGGAPAHAAEPAKDKGIERKRDAPAIVTGPALDKAVEIKTAGETSFMIDKDGKRVPSDREPGVGVMLVKTNSEGKIVELAVTNSDGKFTLNPDDKNSIATKRDTIEKMEMKFDLKKDSENKTYIYLDDPKNMEMLKTARNTIIHIKNMNNITDDIKRPMSFDYIDQPKHGGVPSQTVTSAVKRSNNTVNI